MKRTLLFAFLGLVNLGTNSYAQVLLETFDNSSGYTTSIPEFASGDDFFTSTANNSVGGYTVGLAPNYFAAQDHDGSGGVSPASITWSGLDITGISTLDFSIDVSEEDDNTNEDWDASDFVHVDYSIDGGAFQPLLWLENDGSTFNSAPFVDTDFDGTGDGAEITSGLNSLTASIPSLSGSSLTLQITFSLNAGDEDLAIDNVSLVDPLEPLPVTLTAFNAKPMSGGAMLEWATASEENNDYFAVEMSRDAASFSESAQVKGNGTTESLETYSYELSGLAAGTYYFRLRQVDYDGQSSISDVVSLTIGGNREFFMVSNAVHDIAQIDVTSPRPARILNMAGAVVAEFALTAGRNNLDVSGLANGMYILSDGTNAKRFVK